MAEIQKDIELKQGMSKKTKIIMIIGIVLLLAAIGGGVYWWLTKDASPAEEETEMAAQKAPPVYHEVTSPFIVNFSEQSNNQVRYLQIKMKVMARDQATIDLFALHEPALVHELLMLFYSQNYDDLSTTEGTQALQQASLETINSFLKQQDSSVTGLEAVYFTSLVMQ
ncbi:flagellar basal body-associated FliL family protein [Methylophaga pinxianii]|uniref:flagellar basal body-associated FliL family protein n=1 Tax=Methylophaga pinxianii TaxID=2881052 RepID=UPI001CF1A51D|nr:flagellar basal body-associated FliL family protein [Methylophaga pinxianii]MCB2427235.1 flagellar basal body-associated FliL family protein [Methylophaga pinxianii]UPH46710.1 flagellar basal body-associated FliL family protein [Methylophaga pinxianii]